MCAEIHHHVCAETMLPIGYSQSMFPSEHKASTFLGDAGVILTGRLLSSLAKLTFDCGNTQYYHSNAFQLDDSMWLFHVAWASS
jgi:hypothetical protein